MHVCVFTILLLISVRGGQCSSESLLVGRSVFDDDWRRYLATSLEHDPEGGNDGGVYG
jgi:hypothetical protein